MIIYLSIGLDFVTFVYIRKSGDPIPISCGELFKKYSCLTLRKAEDEFRLADLSLLTNDSFWSLLI